MGTQVQIAIGQMTPLLAAALAPFPSPTPSPPNYPRSDLDPMNTAPTSKMARTHCNISLGNVE
ncbi:unnamed protein product [Penicillium camemberti]|uniref:Str. FM013 n=1 Tax=Penicillium camemberti (strain FM 013) TaxID=1429867 RepID=A0A0G4PMI2_PENC3|nr:unnamed protein product [Penicillium camemberti]